MKASLLLRDATAVAHKSAEAHLDAASIIDGSLSVAGFVKMVDLHYRVWSAVAAWWPNGPGEQPAAKDFLKLMVGKLRQDLEITGTEPAPLYRLSLSADDVATRYGVMYVLRGSTLGGTIINRKLRDCGALSGLPAFHFHTACEELPGREWPTFLRELDAEVQTESQVARTVAGANATFNLYIGG